MYFTVNLAFVNYFENTIENLCFSISKNWTTQKQILPISVEVFEFDPKLLSTPQTLKDFVAQYKNRRELLERKGQQEIEEAKKSSKFGSFLKSFLVDMLLFTVALIITIVGIYMVCGQSKLKALVANIALQCMKAVEAADSTARYCICKPNWYVVGLLLIIRLGITYLVMNKIRKSCLFKGHLFSNVTKVILFI